MRKSLIVITMPVLIVIASALITVLAILFGFFFLRSKLGLQDFFKNQKRCSDETDVDEAGDYVAPSKKPWPIGNDDGAEGEKIVGKRISASEYESSSGLDDYPYLDQIVNLSGDHAHDPKSDPVEYCTHLQREIKKTKQRVAMEKIKLEMTMEQREMERDVQRRQLEDIFRMMEEQKEKFGMSSVDDVRQQMRMYIQ